MGRAGEAEPKDCNCSPQKRHDEDCVTCSYRPAVVQCIEEI